MSVGLVLTFYILQGAHAKVAEHEGEATVMIRSGVAPAHPSVTWRLASAFMGC